MSRAAESPVTPANDPRKTTQGAGAAHTTTELQRWLPLAYWIARNYHLPGGDRDDARQEALIALWDGLRRYDGRGSKSAFLAMCIRRRLTSVLRSARALKHGPLNTAALMDPEVRTGAHASTLRGDEPAASGSLSALAILSPAEQHAALRYAYGYTTAELGLDGQRALWRARHKLKAAA